mmetsp:Transcript_98783/g.274924  ORF Transcript_98783/g.274924 Transcript_98783/m.274924 type:complete len:373 (-) Transcript_98783:506-1624(-)
MLNTQRAAAHRVGLLLRVLLTTDSERQLVDEIRGCCLLPLYDVLACLQLLVALADFSDAPKKSPCPVILQHVRLPLQPACRCKTHVLCLPQQTVLERGYPLDSVLVHDVFVGMARHANDSGHACVLRNVDDHALWKGPLLQQPLLWMLSASTEKLWRFQLESAQLFTDTVDERIREPRGLSIVLLLECLLLFLGTVEPFLTLLLAMNRNVVKVALADVLDDGVLWKDGLECLPEILQENVLRLVVAALHRSEISCDFLGLWIQLHWLPIVLDGYAVRLVLRRVHEAVVLKSVPLLGASLPTQSTILPIPPAVDRLVVILSLDESLGLVGCTGSRLGSGLLLRGLLLRTDLKHQLPFRFFLLSLFLLVLFAIL